MFKKKVINKNVLETDESKVVSKQAKGVCVSNSNYLFTQDGVNTITYYLEKTEGVRILQDSRVQLILENDTDDENWIINNSVKGCIYNEVMEIVWVKENASNVRIIIDNGPDLLCASEHIIMTKSGPKKAKDLKKRSKVLYCVQDIPTMLEKSHLDDLAFILGFIDGSGGIGSSKDGSKLPIYMDVKGKYASQHYMLLKNKLFSLLIKYQRNVNVGSLDSYYVTPKLVVNNISYQIVSAFIYELLQMEFDWKGLHDLPNKILTYSRKKSLAVNYLAAFYLGCGEIVYSQWLEPYIRMVNEDRLYMEIVQILFQSIGIDCKLNSSKNKLGEDFSELIINRNDFKNLYTLFKFTGSPEITNIKMLEKKSYKKLNRYRRVLSISSDIPQDVYLLKESIRGTMVVNNFVVQR